MSSAFGQFNAIRIPQRRVRIAFLRAEVNSTNGVQTTKPSDRRRNRLRGPLQQLSVLQCLSARKIDLVFQFPK